jgi:uncharacterized protein YciI
MNCTIKIVRSIALLITLLSSAAMGQEAVPGNTVFDAELAKALGADRYGMRPYVMAFLKAGPNQGGDPEERRATQAAHLAYIREMAENGDLVMAGPFMDQGEVRGIFIFAVDDLAAAEALTAADPAVQAGRLIMELKPWYGSAALMQVNSIHARIARDAP